MQCEFLDGYDPSVVVKTKVVDFDGPTFSYEMIHAKIGEKFDIVRHEKHDGFYNIVVLDTTVGICDGGSVVQLINIPKSMVRFS